MNAFYQSLKDNPDASWLPQLLNLSTDSEAIFAWQALDKHLHETWKQRHQLAWDCGEWHPRTQEFVQSTHILYVRWSTLRSAFSRTA